MTNQLTKINSDNFYGSNADFYRNENNDIYMTIEQVANCLGYKSRKGIEKVLERNPYLRESEFSVENKLSATDGKAYVTRLICEDGIYEITMLSTKPKAKEFRAFVRKIIKGLRKQELSLINNTTNQQLDVNNQYLCLQKTISQIQDNLNRMESILWMLIPPKPYQDTDWKYVVLEQVKSLAKKHSLKETTILGKIYNKMRLDYDIQLNWIQAKYMRDNPETSRISTLDLIDQHEELHKPFESVLHNYEDLFHETENAEQETSL